ncbi:Arm DNA-binding domain-containing protein [Leptolyngbya sp. 15MV]|nr:Arm DNA-binding domain-containing protein [Leptolyngbya sp. 15MV]
MMPLTALQVKNAKPGRHSDGGGLYLLVKPSGAKSWLLRVQVDGRRRDFGLGSLKDVTLAEAREKAAAARKLARAGKNPFAEAKRLSVSVPTFEDAARLLGGRLANAAAKPQCSPAIRNCLQM